jgi:hypothetical protein
MKKSQNMPVWLKKIVLAQHNISKLAVAGERRSNIVHLQKKSVIDII